MLSKFTLQDIDLNTSIAQPNIKLPQQNVHNVNIQTWAH